MTEPNDSAETDPTMPAKPDAELLNRIGDLLAYRSPSGHEIYHAIRRYLKDR